MAKSIRIISPSGAIDPEYFEGASRRLRLFGYEVSEGIYTRSTHGRFAGTDEQRLSDLTDAIWSGADAIIASRGGYGLQRLISHIEEPRTKLPLLIGFSDITALHQWWGLHGAMSIHGLMCKHLASLPEDSEPIQCWRRAIDGEPLVYPLPSHPLNRPGRVCGTLIGGNLSVLYGLQGTPWSLNMLIDTLADERPILFIEDIAERHYHIERMMLNLKMSGVLERLGGLIVGQFSDCEDDELMGCTIYETIAQTVAEYDYPVLFDFPAGHVERNLPLRLNAPATLTVDGQQASLLN
jgi:muramoyltetrapeptide carboxypeptidase